MNFQQFAAQNKGKLITFKHNDTLLSKVVVDVCGEYFTAKASESDVKIDGFYYFSDCKLVGEKHPLIDVLEDYKIVVLHSSNNRSYIFNYSHYVCQQVNGTCLTTSQPIGFHINSINEAWAIVDGQYKLRYHKPTQEFNDEISLGEVLSSNKDVTIETLQSYPEFNFKSIEGGIICGTLSNGVPIGIKTKSVKRVLSKDGKELYVNKYFENSPVEEPSTSSDTVPTTQNRDAEKYEAIKREFEQFKKLEKLLYMYAPKHVIDFSNALSTIKTSPFSTKALTDFFTVFEAVKSELVEVMRMKLKRDPLLQAFVKRFIELVLLINPNDEKKGIELLNRINKMITPEGKVEYEKLTTDKDELKNQKKYEIIKNEVDNIMKMEKLLFIYAPENALELIDALTYIKSSPFSSDVWASFASRFEAVKGELVKVMSTQFKKDPSFQALVKKMVETILLAIPDDKDTADLLIKINKTMTPPGHLMYDNLFNNIGINIKYRGKHKTIKLINDYTHINGKKYVLVEDLTDNGKTKTLFEEYIQWL